MLRLESLGRWGNWLAAQPEFAAAAGVIAIILLFVIALRMRGRAAQIEFAEIKGRLSAMAEIAAQQNSEQLRGLNERIDALAHRFGTDARYGSCAAWRQSH
jgi:hypothetical protein